MAELRRSERAGSRRRLLWPGVLIGVGVAGTLDEVVLAMLVLLAGVAVLRGSRPVAARDARGPGRC
jgi:hypothetical protein